MCEFLPITDHNEELLDCACGATPVLKHRWRLDRPINCAWQGRAVCPSCGAFCFADGFYASSEEALHAAAVKWNAMTLTTTGRQLYDAAWTPNMKAVASDLMTFVNYELRQSGKPQDLHGLLAEMCHILNDTLPLLDRDALTADGRRGILRRAFVKIGTRAVLGLLAQYEAREAQDGQPAEGNAAV